MDSPHGNRIEADEILHVDIVFLFTRNILCFPLTLLLPGNTQRTADTILSLELEEVEPGHGEERPKT